MQNFYAQIGQKIRELRGALSQDALGKTLGVPSNTVSRWETGTYKPTAEELDRIARHFKVPITVFFKDQENDNDRVAALTSATGGLNKDDFEEVLKYAQFRKARQALEGNKRPRDKR
jgi:transcriptional regulator with XRE-family HTH domain